jgi:hypothetical protein
MTYELAKEQPTLSGFKPFLALKEANGRWLGSAAGYHSIHQWLKRNYGNPSACATCPTKGKKEADGRWSIHWALKRGYIHSHNVAHYKGMCRSCHRKYDMTPKEKARLKAMAQNQTPEQLAKLSIKRKAIAKQRGEAHYAHLALNK